VTDADVAVLADGVGEFGEAAVLPGAYERAVALSVLPGGHYFSSA
jgi:hypothetical protein